MPDPNAATSDAPASPLPQPGERVRIPKGAYISTTHPAGDRIARRSQVVMVRMVFRGYQHDGCSVPAKVSWAGTGGYWCDAWEWEAIDGS